MIWPLPVVVLAALTVAGCSTPATSLDVAPVAVAAAPSGVAAAAALDLLPVKGRAAKSGYSRAQFPHWSDLDGDGCNTREEILGRDAEPGSEIRDRAGCVVGAAIHDPYTGTRIMELPGRDSDVDIEHVVALGDAWVKGAQQLSLAEREALANDPTNLMAVDDRLNRQHGDGDAATWLPRVAVRCGYVARQIAVKLRYRLWVTSSERDAMARVLNACPGEQIPS